ncbi:MAG TPA: SMC family ATPase [Acidimicrobiales bacterium]|nr:SMC family ATPase [Acidimicrobiales bacterium]
MRPVRLELEGFTAFRAPTVVDFDGVDLFALTGATGSGKTSVLDAMVFALYGNVPRLADQRAVAPVIAQGMAEARVRFDFTIGDEAYTATRIVRRTKSGGANTSEARLESDGEVIAGTADDVTAAVSSRLGLTYEHFTKCVVLPQGEFARFLHDKPAARQDLLVSLLDLGVYEQMADLAGQRASAAKADVATLEARQRDLADATPEAIASAATRSERLGDLVVQLEEAAPTLAALDVEMDGAAEQRERLADELQVLSRVRVPGDLVSLHDRLDEVAALVERTAGELAAAEAMVAAGDAALAALTDRAELVRWLDAHERAEGLRERRVKAEALVAERRADATAAHDAGVAAESALAAAREQVELAEAAHRAHAVRGDLVEGEECPVCLQPVTAVPKVKAPPALAKARTARDKVEREARSSADAWTAAAKALAVAEEKLADLTADLADVEARVHDAPARAEVQRSLDEHSRLTEELERGRKVLATARQAHAKAVAERDAAADLERTARAAYDDARDAVAALKPPRRSGASTSLLDEWTTLVDWAGREVKQRTLDVEAIDERIVRLSDERTERLTALAEQCARVELDVPRGTEPVAAAREALGAARATHDTLVTRAADAARLGDELAEAEARRELSHGLSVHLNATHFEKWLLDEALVALAQGATELLMGLSGEQYSLQVDAKSGNFVVVDHRNADEVRSARTLSGGETFLASLALALALADRIATLAARGAARLESIFLDEGFGSLDPDTLDVVASAIEELGATGRVVGVVSHVTELAERLPVRYELERAGNASTIQRFDR